MAVETQLAASPLHRWLERCQEPTVAIADESLAEAVRSKRNEAAAWLAEAQLPSRKDEEWRFTDLSPLLAHDYRQAKIAKVASDRLALISEAQGSRLVFVNGHFAPELSSLSELPEGVFVGNLARASGDRLVDCVRSQQVGGDVFSALNAAKFTDAAVIWVEPNVQVDRPLHLLFLAVPEAEPILMQPRAIAILGTSAKLQLVEQYASLATDESQPYFCNPVTEIGLGANADLTHLRLQEEAIANGFQIAKTTVQQARDSRYAGVAIDIGSKLSRHNFDIILNGEQTETNLASLTAVASDQLADTHSSISHQFPHGTSNQTHKCILSDRARAVFNGKIFVPQAAQLTNASQLNRNLLLSPQARIDTKPQLQITADNVKCAHGATVSQLEPDEIFYLRSRGLSDRDSRQLLVTAFASEILDSIPLDSVRERLTAMVGERTASENS